MLVERTKNENVRTKHRDRIVFLKKFLVNNPTNNVRTNTIIFDNYCAFGNGTFTKDLQNRFRFVFAVEDGYFN